MTPVSIQGVSVDIVEDYKYLGVFKTVNWNGLRTLMPSTKRARAASIS